MRPTIFMAMTLTLAACAATPSGPPRLPGDVNAPPPALGSVDDNVLTGATWVWQGTQMGNEARTVPDAPERYALQFQPGGRVNVRADCNRGSGSYVLDGTRLSFGPIAITKMMCPPESKDGEFLKGLGSVGNISYSGNANEMTLTLKLDSGSMRFTTLPR